MRLDWPSFFTLCQETLASISGHEFVRALVTSSGTTLIPEQGEAIVLPEFRCGNRDINEAHFTASVLERAGFGDFLELRALLAHCNELLAFRRSDGSSSVYTHTRGSPSATAK